MRSHHRPVRGNASVKRLAVGYARVSTDKQADHGVSLDAQSSKIRAMAQVQDVDLAEIITDAGESANTLRRPGLERLLALVDAGQVGVVIVAKLDRLTRSVRDLADLLDRFNRRGVSLVSVSESLDTGSAAGRLVLNVMASVSQWEREAIGERTRDALRHKRAQGKRAGNVPFGYRVDSDGKTLIPEPSEVALLDTMRQLRGQGLTLAMVAERLNRAGYRTRQGSPWRIRTVHHLLSASAA